MVRFLVSLLLGAAVTFALFSFMAFLVSSGDMTKQEALDNIVVEVNTTPPKSAAERALKKWRYKPKVVDGKPQRRPGLTVQLDFTMDKG